MRRALSVALLVAVVGGCAASGQTEAVRKAVDAKVVEGMDDKTTFWAASGVAVPGGIQHPNPGPFQKIAQVNTVVQEGRYAGRNVTFFIGKSRRTNAWEIFEAMVQEGGQWHSLDLRPGKQE